jgi:hypothetical protein
MLQQRDGLIAAHRHSSLAQAGQMDDARASLQRLRELQPNTSTAWVDKYVPYTPGSMIKFLAGLRKASQSGTAIISIPGPTGSSPFSSSRIPLPRHAKASARRFKSQHALALQTAGCRIIQRLSAARGRTELETILHFEDRAPGCLAHRSAPFVSPHCTDLMA